MRVIVLARASVRHAISALRGRDVALWAAGLTFFAVLGLVPGLLLALRGAAELVGSGVVREGTAALAAALPPEHNAGAAVTTLTDAALGASWPVLLAMLFPASFYGEGLRRSLTQAADRRPGRFLGWKGRLGFLPVIVAGPVLVAAALALAPPIARRYVEGGWNTIAGIAVSFHVLWIAVSVAVALVYSTTASTVIPHRWAVAGGLAIGTVLSGFLHGFLLFLAIPIDWSLPFAGLAAVGTTVALALWLYLLHLILIVGYRVLLSVHRVVTGGPE
ncbi:YhjD/YihY/BrkB family envelope integrity protein [Amycolatopsis magusensis]|uniref:YhjD/YihY/BrkB family envelope integrity protein n=1 Tax=Amycolatopsis magusensis TaxID=882444 RepID=UPI003C2D63BD